MKPNAILHRTADELLTGLAEESVDLILTDPPYGLAFDSGKQDYFGEIEGDRELPTGWLKEAYRVLKTGSALYAFTHWRNWHVLQAAAIQAGFTAKNMIVLHKSMHGMGDLRGAYAPKHELLLYATKGRHLLNNPDGRQPDVVDVSVPFSKSYRPHPNYKPSSWLTPWILQSSKPGDLVVDPFTGSGSVPLACVETGRRFLACDVDAQYVEVARRRLEDHLLLSSLEN